MLMDKEDALHGAAHAIPLKPVDASVQCSKCAVKGGVYTSLEPNEVLAIDICTAEGEVTLYPCHCVLPLCRRLVCMCIPAGHA
jgi:hypothetical protein